MLLHLKQAWELGAQIGGGAFGKVYEATSADGVPAAVKLVPKAPGTQRELLFIDLPGVRNVIPIIDDGEIDDDDAGPHWVLVMPRAEQSLREYLDKRLGPLPVADAVTILVDVTAALVDLKGSVVHRDLKPQNILLHDGHWCLADFGISRYAEAATAPDTRRFAFTPLYAAPESWRYERPTVAADVYSVGVIAYELLSGSLPFTDVHDLRRQHLESTPPELVGVPLGLRALVAECLYKAPEARPTPNNLLARLQQAVEPPSSPGLARLQQANQVNVGRIGEASRQASAQQSLTERRAVLAASAEQGLARISGAVRDAIMQYAPSASVSTGLPVGWTVQLDRADLRLEPPRTCSTDSRGGTAPDIDIVSYSDISVHITAGHDGYEGRSHSLWYCDAQRKGEYYWYETAFMLSPLVPGLTPEDPFALSPGRQASVAVRPGMGNTQVAWPFTPLNAGELEEFIGRWAGWLADASQGQLRRPSRMPERDVQGSWRLS